MKSALFAAAGVAVCLTVAGGALLASGALAGTDPVANAAAANQGRRVDDFQLTDHTRMAQHLYYYKYVPAIVIMSRTGGTAYSLKAAAELQKLQATYADRGVLFFMMDSNLGADRDAVAAEAAKQGITIPILMDEQQLVGESMGVHKEGEVFVIDPKTWRAAYHGPLDDRFAKSSPDIRAAPGDAYTAKAIDAVLAGRAVQTAEVDATAGRTIAFPERARAASFANISYTRDIAPILQDKCVSCHINGGIGPFAMNNYQIIKTMAPMIRETVRTRRMPPYFADPHIGQFKHDQSLSSEQTKTLVHWIEAGAPRGEGADPLLANAGKTAPEWPESLGKPDVVVDLPAFNVPATGLVEYQYVRVKNPFGQDAWLRAIAMKPGDRSVLHHVVSNYVPDRTQPAPDIPGGSVGSYTPGAEPQIMADGSGAPIPAGGSLNFQMHYTTNGKATTDRTQVGFYVMKTPPTYIKRSAVIGGANLYIPAGEARHKEVAYLVFPADAYLYTLYPHAHYRGMHVELKSIDAAGKQTMLLSLPKYDFNWQRDYDPVKPILIKAGTKLVATWVYDNSIHNKSNPDPTRNVTWGEQTPDEMMYFRVNYRWADETVAHQRNDLQAKLMGSMLIGALDTNLDGKLELSELHGPIGSRLAARFADLDKDHDGSLDAKELAAVGGMSRRQLAARHAEPVGLWFETTDGPSPSPGGPSRVWTCKTVAVEVSGRHRGGMKLYQTYTSPFPTRVRLVMYAKGIEAEIIEPPGFHSTLESKGDYMLINPIGRVPALVLDDGRVLPESEVICEYLEDAYPEPTLRPADPWALAQVRLISRLCDIYLVMAMVPLFNASGRSRKTWDAGRINAALAEVEKSLGYIETYLGENGYAVGGHLTQADGALAPQLMLAYEWAPAVFGGENPLGKHPKLAAYWRDIQNDPIAARVIKETRDAVAGEQVKAREMAAAAKG